MFPHGSFLLGIRSSLGDEINRANLQKITRDDIRRWRGLYNMTGAEGVSSDRWAKLKARAWELGIDWDHYTPISVGMTVEEPDSEESNNGEVRKMVKTGDVIMDDESCEDETCEDETVNASESNQSTRPAKPFVLDIGESGTYDVIVTFKATIRVRADNARDAIDTVEEKIEDSLNSGDLTYENFQYAVSK